MGGADRRQRGDRRKFYEGLIKELLERAEPHFRLLRYDPEKKKSRLQELQEQERQTKVVGIEIRTLPEMPVGTRHIWGWFSDLNRHRQSSGMATNPLSWSDIDAYMRRFRHRPKPWELRALSRLDGHFLITTAPSNAPAAGGIAQIRAAQSAKER